MNARHPKELGHQREVVGCPKRRLATFECDQFPLDSRQLTSALAHALRVQLKPTLPPISTGFDFQGTLRPTHFVGGDSFGVLPRDDNQLGLFIFDVAGKGPEAALVAARLRALFTTQFGLHQEVKDVLAQVNLHVRPLLSKGRFATALFGLLNPQTRRFTFARAGHEPLIRVNQGQSETLAPEGLSLGIGDQDEFADYLQVESFTLESQERLFLFTDGLTEARNRHHEEFGLGRIRRELENCERDDVGAMGLALSKFVGNEPQHDDLTMLSVSPVA